LTELRLGAGSVLTREVSIAAASTTAVFGRSVSVGLGASLPHEISVLTGLRSLSIAAREHDDVATGDPHVPAAASAMEVPPALSALTALMALSVGGLVLPRRQLHTLGALRCLELAGWNSVRGGPTGGEAGGQGRARAVLLGHNLVLQRQSAAPGWRTAVSTLHAVLNAKPAGLFILLAHPPNQVTKMVVHLHKLSSLEELSLSPEDGPERHASGAKGKRPALRPERAASRAPAPANNAADRAPAPDFSPLAKTL
jgi:hypothetical protein